MLSLRERIGKSWEGDAFVARVTADPCRAPVLRAREALLVPTGFSPLPHGFAAYLERPDAQFSEPSPPERGPVLPISVDLQHLGAGDIIQVTPEFGEISVLYRRQSSANTILVTEECNSHCIMCPQPSRKSNSESWLRLWLAAIPLIHPDTCELAISGGEPTLHPHMLLQLIRACRNALPRTALQVLTNGRMFNYMSLCRAITVLRHPDLLFSIPLQSDLSHVHDFVAQVDGAYDQTLRGIMNLRRHRQRIEIRVVLVRATVARLEELARFIARNLPFVEHVALMEMEPIGLAYTNLSEIWIDPVDYQPSLKAAVGELTCRGINVSIFNSQLCVLDPSLWAYAQRSISDWKREYLAGCEHCMVRSDCGGLFASAVQNHSRAVRPLACAPA
jgi:His-Xaa-Ser system radical SAM maturase HxsC